MKKATGTFNVKIGSLAAYNTSPEAKLGRMSIDKEFHGDLVGTVSDRASAASDGK